MSNHRLPATQLWNIGAAGGFDSLYRAAAAHTVDQPDMGQPQLEGQTLGAIALLADRGVGRTAAHGEIVARDHDRAAIDLGGRAIKVGAGDSLATARLDDPAQVWTWLEAQLP